ncbi:alpha/beta hydrolase [Marinobacterium aestuariivivens]|uniref:Alpha/beta hydrolase n=1 Tax=Marinobacterium aestuariivivens TaxID=1698799 RepID=A0ABW2A5K4_9GAMM
MKLHKTIKTTPMLFGLALAAFQGQAAQAGEIRHYSYPSDMLDRAYTYNIYLPDGYDKADRVRYPVIYALHGSGGDEYNWTRKGRKFGGLTHIEAELDRLIADKQLQPSIVVFPGAYQSWWIDGLKEPAMTAFVDEFVPRIEKEWKGIGGKGGRALVGLSMGAYGALNLSLRYPERFAAAALLSPSVFSKEGEVPENNNVAKQDAFVDQGRFDKGLYGQNHYSNYLDGYRDRASPVAFYISGGDSDKYGVAQTAFEIYGQIKPLQPKMTALNIIPETDHEWKAWNDVVGEALGYMAYHLDYPGDASARGVDAYNGRHQ